MGRRGWWSRGGRTLRRWWRHLADDERVPATVRRRPGESLAALAHARRAVVIADRDPHGAR